MENKKKLFDKNGHITDIYICICSDSLREDKEDTIPDEIRSHLEGCEQCRNTVLDIYSTTLALEERQRSELTPFSYMELPKRSFSYRLVFRTAATFLILGFITAVYLLMDNKEPISKRLANRKADSIISAIDPGTTREKITPEIKKESISSTSVERNPQLTHNPFKDNPNLEYMVNSHYRGRLIHIISPEFKIMEKGKIIFMWENHIDKHLELKILNNLNETLFKAKAEGSRVEFKGDLSPGLYYWKLEDRENLYHVGKFMIEK